jgi:hypothetical protein
MPEQLMPDPWSVLGLSPDATIEQARAARRLLAKQLHPDLHAGLSAGERTALTRRMTEVNRALAQVEATSSVEHPTPEQRPDPLHPPADPMDRDTFTVAALPVEAFEALFLAAYGLGDILVADEPYALELYLVEPAPCFCQLTIVPEAGGSMVLVDVAAPAEDGTPPPPVELVRDLLVAELNELSAGVTRQADHGQQADQAGQTKGRSSHHG